MGKREVLGDLLAALEPFARDYADAGVPDSIRDNQRWADVDQANTELLVGDFRRAAELFSKRLHLLAEAEKG